MPASNLGALAFMQAAFPPNNGGWQVRSTSGKETEWLASNMSCEEMDVNKDGKELTAGKQQRRRHSAPAGQGAGKGDPNAADAGGDDGGDGAGGAKEGGEELTKEERVRWWKETMRDVKELLGATC